MEYKVNGVTIKRPSSFKVERYNVTTMERLTNGDMVGDLVAKKRKFYFTYDAISAEEFDKILDALWNTDLIFYPLEYPYQGEVKTADVYVGSIPSDLYKAGRGANWVWSGVSFNLIER